MKRFNAPAQVKITCNKAGFNPIHIQQTKKSFNVSFTTAAEARKCGEFLESFAGGEAVILSGKKENSRKKEHSNVR